MTTDANAFGGTGGIGYEGRTNEDAGGGPPAKKIISATINKIDRMAPTTFLQFARSCFLDNFCQIDLNHAIALENQAVGDSELP